VDPLQDAHGAVTMTQVEQSITTIIQQQQQQQQQQR